MSFFFFFFIHGMSKIVGYMRLYLKRPSTPHKCLSFLEIESNLFAGHILQWLIVVVIKAFVEVPNILQEFMEQKKIEPTALFISKLALAVTVTSVQDNITGLHFPKQFL